MQKASIGIFGASGYTGIEAARLLCGHSRASVRFLTSDRWAGERVERRLGLGGAVGQLTFVSPDEGAKLIAQARSVDAVLLATPAEVSAKLAPELLRCGVKVVDLSGAFRLRQASAYPVHYGFAHPAPELLSEAVYGLPELNREAVRKARLVANPGCYPTAATLSLAPLLEAGLIEPDSIVVNAASGVSGAGRKASEDFSFMEIDGDFRAYKVFSHQHEPEIRQTLEGFAQAGTQVPLTFTTHLLPVKRGILSTSFARLKPGVGDSQVAAAFADAYRNEPCVELAARAEEVALKRVVHTPRCQLGFACKDGRLLVLAAIDNLLKGAASQAVQNLNLMMGWDETEGLARGESAQ